MRSLVPKLLIASIAMLAAVVWVPAASAAPGVSGKFELGSELGSNNKIAAGPDGNMWFTLEGAKDVGDITPAGLVREFELPKIENPIGIAAGPEGRIWVVAIEKATSFLPSDPEGTEETFTSEFINAQANIGLGPENMFWVASNEAVAKFSPANFKGTITEVPLEGEMAPKDIDVAGPLIVISDNDMSPVTELGRIVTFTSAGIQRDITIPGGSQGLSGAPSGQIAYSAASAVPEQAGLVVPPGTASAFELLGDPFGVAYGGDQAFWIVRFAAGGLTRLTSTGETSFVGGLPVESARQVAAGPGNTLWVTLEKKELKGQLTSGIARISGLEPPVTAPPTTGTGSGGSPVPDTKLGKLPKKVVKTAEAKATVKFTFTSSVAGSSFQCSLIKVPAPKKGKKAKAPKPVFAGCRSPKVLHLGSGKYRFAVRAVAAGGSDASPAESVFTVVRLPQHPKHR